MHELKIKNDVLIDEQDNLFLYQGAHNQFDYLTGKKRISSLAIDTYNKNLFYRSRFCEENDMKYLHVVFPSKPLLFKKELSSLGLNVKSIFNSEHLHKNTVYPIKELELEKSYYKNDTHCQPLGSWACLEVILEKLNLNYSETPCFKNEERKSGDLSVMLNETDRLETANVFLGLKGRAERSIRVLSNQNAIAGNNGAIKIVLNSMPVINKRVVIFGDSFFGGTLLSIMSEFFSEIFYMRSPHFHSDLLSFINPDIVLSGQAERYLTSAISDLERAPAFFNYLNGKYDSSKVSDSFSKGLKAILSPKDSRTYLHWANSFVGNSLRNKSIQLKNTDFKRALELMKNANNVLPNNENILKLLDEMKNNNKC